MKPTKAKLAWSSTPPPGLTACTHNFSIVPKIEEAVSLLRTDPSVENPYVIVGWDVRSIIESLPQFEPRINESGLRDNKPEGVYLGDLGQKKVYLDLSEKFQGFEIHDTKGYVLVEVTA